MNFKFCYGVITDGSNSERITTIINSIESWNLPADSYQVVVVGGGPVDRKNTIHIPFNENEQPGAIKGGWITRKKNLITKHSKFDNIVYSHDYICPDKDWYSGFCRYGDDYKVCSNKIFLPNKSTRFRDWIIAPVRKDRLNKKLINKIERHSLLPYDVTHLHHFVVIGGYYWVAKKHIMEEFPLEEKLVWGEGEDFRWCHAVQEVYDVSFNPHSSCYLLKEKDPLFHPLPEKVEDELRLLEITEEDIVHDYPHYEYKKPIDWD